MISIGLLLPRKTNGMEFVVNDESKINSRGFVLLNAGMAKGRYESNPVMLYAHDDRQVIGRWKGLRTEDGKMYLTAEYDEADPAAKLIKGKVERGFLRGASLGLIPLDAEYRILDGKEVLCVTRWEWLECSICSIPSNAGALSVQVYDSNRKPVSKEDLSAYLDKVVRLSTGHHNYLNKNKMTMNLTTETYTLLGIPAEAGAEAVEKAVQGLANRAVKAEKELRDFQDAQKASLKADAEKMVMAAVENGKIKAEKKDQYVRLAMADMTTAKEVLDALPGKTSYADMVAPIGLSSIPSERKDWTAKDWMKKDMPGLMKLKVEHPAEYSRLFNR